MTRITIIRHAEAEGNYYRRAHGHYDSLLTPNGIAQTEALRERMKDVLFDAVYSSDLYRTKRTASVLRGWDGSPTHLLPSLRELCLGSWEDVPWGELAESDASALSIFMHQPGQFLGRGERGESMAAAQSRMHRAVRSLTYKHIGQHIAVVSHGLAIRALMAALSGTPCDRLHEIPHTDNAAVSCVEWEGTGEGKAKTLYYGDNSHLGALSTLARQHWWRRGSGMTDINLWFRPITLPHDLPFVLHSLRDAWMTVYGTMDGFADDIAVAHAERMAVAHPRAVAHAMHGQKPIGLVQLDTEVIAPYNDGHVALVYLTREARGQSLGAQLMGHAVSVYRTLGREHLHLRVAESNITARRLYANLGFQEASREEGRHGKLLNMRMRIAIDENI